MTFKIISLFSGAGGMDIGFTDAGFEIAVAVESDPACCETLAINRPTMRIINELIEDVPTSEILKKAELKPLEAALVIGGPPCQPFSLAGNRQGLNDPRGHLVMEFIRVVRESLPVGFVMENVRGLVNWGQGEALRLILDEIRKPIKYGDNVYSYTVAEPKVLNAVDYGVPQNRERVFIIGNRININYNYPIPTHYPDNGMNLWNENSYATVEDALRDLPKPEEPSPTAQRVSQTIKKRIVDHGY